MTKPASAPQADRASAAIVQIEDMIRLRDSRSPSISMMREWASVIEALAASAQVREGEAVWTGEVECCDAKGMWLIMADNCPFVPGQKVRIATDDIMAAEPFVHDDDLPGMWERADFMGGATDSLPAPEPVPVAQGDMAHRLEGLARALQRRGYPDNAKLIREAIADHARISERQHFLLSCAEQRAEKAEASLAACRADAERWQWLRRNASGGTIFCGGLPGGALNCDEPETEWDAAIDAARSQP